jgi:hypothetical protein
MNSRLFKYRFFSLNLLDTPSKFANVAVFLIVDLHNIPYIIYTYIPHGLVGASCVSRYHGTSNRCVATLSVHVCAVVQSENRNWFGNTVSILTCTLCTMLHREKWKWFGNTVSTHISTLPCYIVKHESGVATLSVHIYALCSPCYTVKHESGVATLSVHTQALCLATSWNMKMV